MHKGKTRTQLSPSALAVGSLHPDSREPVQKLWELSRRNPWWQHVLIFVYSSSETSSPNNHPAVLHQPPMVFLMKITISFQLNTIYFSTSGTAPTYWPDKGEENSCWSRKKITLNVGKITKIVIFLPQFLFFVPEYCNGGAPGTPFWWCNGHRSRQ